MYQLARAIRLGMSEGVCTLRIDWGMSATHPKSIENSSPWNTFEQIQIYPPTRPIKSTPHQFTSSQDMALRPGKKVKLCHVARSLHCPGLVTLSRDDNVQQENFISKVHNFPSGSLKHGNFAFGMISSTHSNSFRLIRGFFFYTESERVNQVLYMTLFKKKKES